MTPRRRAPWLLAAAPVLLWGSIWLAQLLASRTGVQQSSQIEWPAADTAGIQRVVVQTRQAAQGEWLRETRVRFDDGATIRVAVTDRDDGEPTTLRLEREGSTLFIRDPLPPATGASAPQERQDTPHIWLRLPTSIRAVQAPRLDLTFDNRQRLPALEATAHELSLIAGPGAVERLRLVSPPRAFCDGGPLRVRSGKTEVQLKGVAQLSVQSVDGEVDLRVDSVTAPASMELTATPETRLSIAPVGSLPALRWTPMSPEQAVAQRQIARAAALHLRCDASPATASASAAAAAPSR